MDAGRLSRLDNLLFWPIVDQLIENSRRISHSIRQGILLDLVNTTFGTHRSEVAVTQAETMLTVARHGVLTALAALDYATGQGFSRYGQDQGAAIRQTLHLMWIKGCFECGMSWEGTTIPCIVKTEIHMITFHGCLAGRSHWEKGKAYGTA